LASVIFGGSFAAELSRDWKAWLAEVAPIMSRAEASVFKSLGTEEDRRRFQDLFWKVRDAVPGKPRNEFREDYYARLRHVRSRLGGPDTDRGRIYLILGRPGEIQTFTLSDVVVDCELWIYQGTGRPGLPPLMYLLFYKKDNIGDLLLYQPGMNSPLEVLATNNAPRTVSRGAAVRTIGKSYPELAKATLSVIPDEANVSLLQSPGSSSTVLAQLFSLPEREVEKRYLQGFGSPQGAVDVSYTTREVAGKGAVSVTEHLGLRFLGCALMPDVLRTVRNTDGFHTARIVLDIRVEDPSGRTIVQRDREVALKLDGPKLAAVEAGKLVLSDLLPIIPGRFTVILTYSNRTTEEFFVHREEVVVPADGPSAILGYKIKELPEGTLTPFSLGRRKVLADPRSLFGPDESVEGLVLSTGRPVVRLLPREAGTAPVEVTDLTLEDGLWLFRKPLIGVPPGNYDLVVEAAGAEVLRRMVTVISFEVAKPLELERTESAGSLDALRFEVGQELMNAGRADAALEVFEALPSALWDARTLPDFARAQYLAGHYERAVALLERPEVERTYPVLLILGNASLELRELSKAAEYFELVRKYGDTPENNRILSAIYLSLGELEKARVCRERADALDRERATNKESK
jgi:GWxTD domain-containing protein